MKRFTIIIASVSIVGLLLALHYFGVFAPLYRSTVAADVCRYSGDPNCGTPQALNYTCTSFCVSDGSTAGLDQLGKPAIERQIHDLVNAERAKARLAPLAWNQEAADVASAWSKEMSSSGKFEHSTTFCYGENIFARIGGTLTAEEVVSGWVNSPSHKANLLYPDFTSEGIGVYNGYVTENFC